jgi:hypothetical protein
MKTILVALIASLAQPALAQTAGDTFQDRDDGAKAHASGFVCPQKIGEFERDAVGEADPETKSDFCAYSAIGGVYGTVRLTPLSGPYDPKAALRSDFSEQEATGGKRIGETPLRLKNAPVSVYTRTYSTGRAESLEYRIVFTGARIGNWAVETTVEYADPRDAQTEVEFLQAIYSAAVRQIVE